MSKKFLLTTAAAVGMLAAGSANAADVNPVVVAPVVVAPVAVPGPVYTVTISTGISTGAGGGLYTWGQTEVDIRLPSGFGVEVGTFGDIFLDGGLDDADASLWARGYKALGEDTTLGVFIEKWWDWDFPGPLVFTGTEIGVDLEYDKDDHNQAYAYLSADLVGGTFAGFGAGFDGIFTLPNNLVLSGDAFVYHPAGGPSYGNMYGQVGYKFGFITPYVGAGFGWTSGIGIGGWGATLGVELEKEFNDALTLTGWAEIYVDGGGYDGFGIGGEIEYEIGDGPLTINGFANYFAGGNWNIGVGIELEFGGDDDDS